MTQAPSLYLDLLKRCLSNVIYRDDSFERSGPMQPIVGTQAFSDNRRSQGSDWPSTAHTMIGLKRLDNIQACIEKILADKIPGDLIETGVWRGGATIFMWGCLKCYGAFERRVWVADSFEGLPPPNSDRYPLDRGLTFNKYEYLAVSLEQVQENFRRYNLLDEQVRFLRGWFKETLPVAPIEKLALLRIDGDLYESTIDALVNLYPKLSEGGFVIIDDYNDIPACRQAVMDYRRTYNITAPIIDIDWTGVYWNK